MIGNISSIINNLSSMNESTRKSGKKLHKCKNCSGISEGVMMDGTVEVCPLCDVELTSDSAYEPMPTTSPVRESEDLTDEDKEYLDETIEEMEGTLKEYKKLILERKFYKARKLVEEADLEVIADSEGVTDDGDIEEDSISVQKEVQLENGDNVTLKVTDSTEEYDDDEDDEEEPMAERYFLKGRRSRRGLRESLEDSKGNISTLIDSKFRDFGFAVVDVHETKTDDEMIYVDITLNASETNTKAYVEDIIEELIAETNTKIDFKVTDINNGLMTLSFSVYLNRPVVETANLVQEVPDELKKDDTAVPELITEYEEELKDELGEVVESHRRKHRNFVIRESLEMENPKALSDEDEIIQECDELEDDIKKTVESVKRKFRRKLKEDTAGKNVVEQSAEDLIDEVEELVESYKKKRISKRKRLVESDTKNTIEDVIDADEDLLEELEDDLKDKVEESVEGAIEDKDKVLEEDYDEDEDSYDVTLSGEELKEFKKFLRVRKSSKRK